jgi:flagellar FliL protein
MSVIFRIISITFIGLSLLWQISVVAAEENSETNFVDVNPVIITNFLRAKGKKPGFVQVQAYIGVTGKDATATVEKHMPLIRDTIIEFLSFTEEAVIKDVSKRQELRQAMFDKINSRLKEVVGHPYAEELVFTHFMWG